MSHSKKIKWGILGCGKIAHKFALDLALSDNGELYACASRSLDKAKSFAESHNITRYFSSYEDLATFDEVEIVYIATPHSFHHDHSILCMEQGKHVLCEKPLGINYHEVNTMIQVARRHNVLLMEAMWTAFLPAIQDVICCVKGSAIGEIRHLKADFGFKAIYDPKSRLFDPVLAGGSLLDIGIYPLYISLILMGIPSEIYAVGNKSVTGVDSECMILLKYNTGATAALYATLNCNTDTTCEIYGTHGKIHIPRRFHEADHYFLSKEATPEMECSVGKVGLGYWHEIEHIHHCILNGLTESPVMSFDTSTSLIQLLDQVGQKIKGTKV